MSDVVIHPERGEVENVRRLVDEGLTKAKGRLGEVDIEVYLSWSNDEFVAERMGGVKGYASTDDPGVAWIDVVAGRYEDVAVRAGAVHEYTHVWEFSKHKPWDDRWERFRGEGVAQVIENEITDYNPPYSQRHTVSDVANQWGVARNMLDDPVQKFADGFFITDDDDSLPNWYGYSASYHAVDKLIQEKSVEDVMRMGEEAFVSSLDEMYGGR